MNFWVEYWNDTNKTDNGSHAQMKEQLHWVEPDPNIISRRYFSTIAAATEFAKTIEKRRSNDTNKTRWWRIIKKECQHTNI